VTQTVEAEWDAEKRHQRTEERTLGVPGPIGYGRERIIVASRGWPKAVVISIEELEDALAVQEALDAYEAGETTSWQKVKAELVEDAHQTAD
jgi:hypothetical protein